MESPSERPFRLKNLKRLPAVNNSVMPITGAATGEVPTGVDERAKTPSLPEYLPFVMGTELPSMAVATDRSSCSAHAGVPGAMARSFVRKSTVAGQEACRKQSTADAGRAAQQIDTAIAENVHEVPPVAPLQDGPGPRGMKVQTWSWTDRRSEDVRIDTPTDEEKKLALDCVQQSRSGSTMLPVSGTLSFATRRHGHSKTDSTAKYLIVPSGEPGGGNGSDGGIPHVTSNLLEHKVPRSRLIYVFECLLIKQVFVYPHQALII